MSTIRSFLSIILVLLIAVGFMSCTGKANDPTPVPDPTPVCGETSVSSYTVSWDRVINTDLSGYLIYFAIGREVSKNDSDGKILIDPGSIDTQFTPSNNGIAICDDVFMGITALGFTSGESGLSDILTFTVDE